MKCEDFLNNCEDITLRKKICRLFEDSENEAKWFGSSGGKWIEIIGVKHMSGVCNWSGNANNAKITIDARWDDLGVILAEIFHSAFESSKIRNYTSENKYWAKGFCNAFRYYMEGRDSLLIKDGFWVKKFNENFSKDYTEILKGDKNWEVVHGIPAYEIIKKSEKNYEGFQKLWMDLNSTPCKLDNYFGYSVVEYADKYNVVLP